jgi:hypothetical protein
MTLDEIAAELGRLDLDFALVTRRRTASLGSEELRTSLDDRGAPEHPAVGAWLLCRGIQRALEQCDADPRMAAELSSAVAEFQKCVGGWLAASEKRSNVEAGGAAAGTAGR